MRSHAADRAYRALPCAGGCDTLCMQAHDGVLPLSDGNVILDQHVAEDAAPDVRGEDVRRCDGAGVLPDPRASWLVAR